MKLNLGCAKDIRKGYKNVDLHYKHPEVINEDISNLSFVQNNTVEEIIAHDIIEHLPFNKSAQCLKIWFDYLQKGGKISIQTTNFNLMIKAYSEKVWDICALNYMLFAGINYTDVGSQECDFHKSVYSPEFIFHLLKNIGYKNIKIKEDSIDENLKFNAFSHNLNLYVTAEK